MFLHLLKSAKQKFAKFYHQDLLRGTKSQILFFSDDKEKRKTENK